MKKLIETIIAKIQRRDPCFEIYPYYGIMPHEHRVIVEDGKLISLGTVSLAKEKWPDNFVEDTSTPCCGTFYCPNKKCKAKCESRLKKKEHNCGE